MKKSVISIVCTIILSGCASTGPIYTTHEAINDKAQILIYRPSASMGSLRSPNIEINGIQTCDLASGSYIARNVDSGETTISASLWDMPGTSRLEINTKPHNKYYIRVSFDGSKLMGAAFGGMIGMGAVEAISTNRGPFIIQRADNEDGNREISETNIATSCK